jgi:hypothetical protein
MNIIPIKGESFLIQAGSWGGRRLGLGLGTKPSFRGIGTGSKRKRPKLKEIVTVPATGLTVSLSDPMHEGRVLMKKTWVDSGLKWGAITHGGSGTSCNQSIESD